MALDKHKQKEKVFNHITKLVNSNYWGDIVVKLENGNCVHVKTTQSMTLIDKEERERKNETIKQIERKKESNGFKVKDTAKIT